MPPDQPRPEVKPTREHRALAAKIQYKYDNWLEGGPVALWIEDGHPRAIVREAIPTAELLASFGEAAEERGRRLERERLAPLFEAFAIAKTYVGCGDNSCLFVKPSGMATNGGCRCVERGTGRPFVTAALAGIYKAVAALSAQPEESATPSATEEPALELKCSACGDRTEGQRSPGLPHGQQHEWCRERISELEAQLAERTKLAADWEHENARIGKHFELLSAKLGIGGNTWERMYEQTDAVAAAVKERNSLKEQLAELVPAQVAPKSAEQPGSWLADGLREVSESATPEQHRRVEANPSGFIKPAEPLAAPAPDVERLRRLEEWLEREAQSRDSDHPDRAPAYALVLAMLKEALGGKP